MSCNCSRLRKILEGKTEGMRIALPQEENASVIKKMKGHYEKDINNPFSMPTPYKTIARV